MGGIEVYRAVNGVSNADIDKMVLQVMTADNTYFSDKGGSAVGRGLYSYDNLRNDISGYARGQYSAMMRFKIKSDAKIGDFTSVYSDMRASRLGDKILHLCNNDITSAVSVYALSKGYTVLARSAPGGKYYNILSREAVVMSSTYHRLSREEKMSPPSKWNELKG